MPTDHPTAALAQKNWTYISFFVNAGDLDEDGVYDAYVTGDSGLGYAAVSPFTAQFMYYRDRADYPPDDDHVQIDPFNYDPDRVPEFYQPTWKINDHLFEQLGNPTSSYATYQPTPAQMLDLGYFDDASYNDAITWGGNGTVPPPHPQTYQIPLPVPDNKIAEHCFYFGNPLYADQYTKEASYYNQLPLTGLRFDFDVDPLPVPQTLTVHWEIIVTGSNCKSSASMAGGVKNATYAKIGDVETIAFDAQFDGALVNGHVDVYVGSADPVDNAVPQRQGIDTVGEGAFLVESVTATRTWTLEGGGPEPFQLDIAVLPDPSVVGMTVGLTADITSLANS